MNIPGKFYWMPNAVADYWSDFRYPVMKKIPTGEMGINRRPAYRYESTGKGKRLKVRDFSIYHVFCRWADNTTRECELYLSYICRHLGISHNSLVTHLQHMEGARLISMERGRIDPETGAPAPTWFKLLDLEEARQHGIALSNDCFAEDEDDDEGVSNIADTPEEIAGGISSNDGGISNFTGTPVKIDRGDIENCRETYQ